MSGSPVERKAPPPRLKIQLPLPGQFYPQPGMGYVSTPYGQTPMPMTPVSGQPQVIYSNKASEFVFSQFKGIKDLTKSGLSVGEKSAFWLYEKVCVNWLRTYMSLVYLCYARWRVLWISVQVSSWSKRWFTHIFLFIIVLLYSIGGAMIFVTIEGTNEDMMHGNIRKER